MAITSDYPFTHHPCYSNNRSSLWYRIHLPVAPVCNVKCAFCSHSVGSSCHTSKPGISGQIMTPESAVARTRAEIEKNPRLKIVAISGPGEPLTNPETFETLEMIREEFKDIAICVSTNGTLLEDNVDWLRKTQVDTITVSMSTANISTASKIYEWARFGNDILQNEEMGSRIVNSQLRGISKASKAGIHVKVNSILIPEINSEDIPPLAREISRLGAALQNIVPLVPNDSFSDFRAPTIEEISEIRKRASTFMKQFSHCKQCRSDVVGIPGSDRIL
jgi:nitrogen fixation protein NifB